MTGDIAHKWSLRLGVSVVLASVLLAGCAGEEDPAIPTDGLLVAADLGPGEWAGPFPRGLRDVVKSGLFPWCRD